MKTILNATILFCLFLPATLKAMDRNIAPPPLTYCASNGQSQYWEYIDYVAIGTISRSSGAETGGYYDGTAMSTDVVAGSTYTLTFSHANPWGGYVEDWAIYIDWNADGDFVDAGETALKAIAYTSVNQNYQLSIPAAAALGATRMRVSMRFYAYPPPCGTFNQGEVEDYTLNIVGGSACSESFEPNNTKGSAKAIAAGVVILSQISMATDIDWYSFSNTPAAPNIKVALTNLPANYDLQLFDPAGVKVATSKNSGTTDETIIYNTGIVGKYKIKVLSKNGAFSNMECYTLQANIGDIPYRLSPVTIAEVINELALYPNPVSSELAVEFNASEVVTVSIRIMNMPGQQVYSRSEIGVEGSNLFTVDVTNLADGIYYLVLMAGDGRIAKEFIVSH